MNPFTLSVSLAPVLVLEPLPKTFDDHYSQEHDYVVQLSDHKYNTIHHLQIPHHSLLPLQYSHHLHYLQIVENYSIVLFSLSILPFLTFYDVLYVILFQHFVYDYIV